MATRLRFEVDVHLDFDDGNWSHSENPDITRDETIKLNVLNIAEAIQDVVVHEYGVPYVTVSARLLGLKEDSQPAASEQEEISDEDLHAHIYNELVEQLYDIDPEHLRMLALECLLISDGPDKV